MSRSSDLASEQEIEAAYSCAGILNGLGETFLKAFHETERDFLRLGAELEKANAKAMALADEAGLLAATTSGDEVAHAADSLGAVLGRIVSACELGAKTTDFDAMGEIVALGVELTGIMRDFSRLVKHLSILGVATRIESARLGGSGLGFSTLADDVETLALKIATSSGTIVSRCAELTAQTLAAQQSMKDLQTVREGCSLTIVDVLKKDLDALGALIRASGDTARETSDQATGLCENVSSAVLSLQFHDIVRQQLEHVAEHSEEVRREVLSELNTPDATGEQEPAGQFAPWLHSALMLQRSQLGDARMRFAEAMQNLEESLLQISTQIEALTVRAGELTQAGDGQESVLSVVESGVAGVVDSLRQYFSLGESMASVMTGVKSSIDQMSVSATEIEEVGSEIELIAINASIKAAHTGDEGKALGVLASAIQKLSLDAAVQTTRVMELLADVDRHSQGLHRATSRQTDQEGLESVFDDLHAEITTLKRLDAQVAESARAMRAKGQTLAGEISNSVSSLSFQEALLASMTAAEERLQNAVELMIPVLPPGGANLESPRLKAMLARYTMDAERLVHESVLGGKVAPSGALRKTASPDDLGDNIELF